MKTTELSPVEARLIQAFRRADERAQADALDVLTRHPAKSTTGSRETLTTTTTTNTVKVIDVNRIAR